MDRFCDALKAWTRLAAELAKEIQRIKAELVDLERAAADRRDNIVRLEASPPLAPSN